MPQGCCVGFYILDHKKKTHSLQFPLPPQRTKDSKSKDLWLQAMHTLKWLTLRIGNTIHVCLQQK